MTVGNIRSKRSRGRSREIRLSCLRLWHEGILNIIDPDHQFLRSEGRHDCRDHLTKYVMVIKGHGSLMNVCGEDEPLQFTRKAFHFKRKSLPSKRKGSCLVLYSGCGDIYYIISAFANLQDSQEKKQLLKLDPVIIVLNNILYFGNFTLSSLQTLYLKSI